MLLVSKVMESKKKKKKILNKKSGKEIFAGLSHSVNYWKLRHFKNLILKWTLYCLLGHNSFQCSL